MKAAGYGAWWNNYGAGAGTVTPKEMERARAAAFVITKAGYWATFAAFRNAGVRQGVEVYLMPNQVDAQAARLRDGVLRGAEFVVINAEVEWESQPAGAMRAFLDRLPRDVEVYSCTDTRGGRMQLPYQLELAARCTAFMPMIYPKAFQQNAVNAFRSSLDSGQNFAGKPVLPAIQAYDGPGAAMVREQVAECIRRGLPGCQAYTLNEGHATDAEWSVFIAAIPNEEEDDLNKDETLALIIPEIDRRVGATNKLLADVGTYARDTRTVLGMLGDKVEQIGAGVTPDLADVKDRLRELETEHAGLQHQLEEAAKALGGD